MTINELGLKEELNKKQNILKKKKKFNTKILNRAFDIGTAKKPKLVKMKWL